MSKRRKRQTPPLEKPWREYVEGSRRQDAIEGEREPTRRDDAAETSREIINSLKRLTQEGVRMFKTLRCSEDPLKALRDGAPWDGSRSVTKMILACWDRYGYIPYDRLKERVGRRFKMTADEYYKLKRRWERKKTRGT